MVVEKSGRRVSIRMTAPGDCDRCGICAGGRRRLLELERSDLEVGDRVRVEIPDSALVRFSILFYLLPALVFALGFGLGAALWPGWWGGLAGGAAGLAAVFAWGRFSRSGGRPEIEVHKEEGDEDARED
ncbi:MAG TPA: SoxR reducing system RseC family protein [bacterium]|nr:SoxR reducing system RseC family protein [bacterium]